MIYWSKILLLGAFIVLNFSCSRFILGKSKNTYTADGNAREQSNDNRVVVKTSKSDDKNDKSWLEIAENAESSDAMSKYENPPVHKDIDVNKFNEKEIEHVSISNYDPFDKRGEMYLDLRSMAKEFHYPANGHLLSNFGQRGRGYHSGVDIKAEKGDNIYAAFDGVVRMSSYYGGYGNMIVVRHYNGLETVYSHNTKNLVKPGEKVSAGDVIAYAGKTGRATGYHVHFEVRVLGQVINPNLLINTTEKSLQDRDLFIYNRSGKVYASNNSTKRQKVAEEVAKVEKTESAPTPVATKEKKVDSSASNGSSVHIIKSGDTLYKISKQYKTTIAELCRLNNIKERAVLSLGQKIKVN